MPYQKTQWINNNEPSINAQNLNKIEQGIYDNSIAVETQAGLLDGHTVRKDVPSNAVFTDTIYDDTALTARVQANETSIETLENTTVKWSEQNELGAKNLIPFPYDNKSTSTNGVTFDITDEGVITATATSVTSGFGFPIVSSSKAIILNPLKSYIFSGITGGSSSTVRFLLDLWTADHDPKVDTRDTRLFCSNAPTTIPTGYKYLSITLYFYTNAPSVLPKTFYPMLRLATIEDSAFEPYAMSNRKLTTDKVGWESNGLLGAKNKIPYPHQETTKTENGLTFTDNGNGTITVNGTHTTGNVQYYLCTRSIAANRIPLKAGTYRLTGCPTGGNRDTFSIYLNGYNAGTTTAIAGMRDTGEGVTMSYSNDIVVGIYLDIRYDAENPLTFDNVVFRPMLTIGEDKDDTYAEYAMTNRELTVKKANTSALGTDESGRTTASKAYAQGDYFYKDGQFCKALTSIASGATFTLNTNYAAYTLADILKTIENA